MHDNINIQKHNNTSFINLALQYNYATADHRCDGFVSKLNV